MAKKENTGNSFDEMFFPASEINAKIKPVKQPEEAKTVEAEKTDEEKKTLPVSANKRGRKAKESSVEQSEGKKTVTVYLNAENWAQFCLIATLRKPSASAWLDELIAEEIRKNKNVLDIVNSIK